MTSLMERRGFLNATFGCLSTLITGALGVVTAKYLVGGSKCGVPEAWADAGDMPVLQPDTPRQIAFQRTRVDAWDTHTESAAAWVVKRRAGDLIVLAPQCTHLGCAYHWASDAKCFVCPCHGSTFAPDGRVLSGPAPRPLERLQVQIQNNRLWLGPLVQQHDRS